MMSRTPWMVFWLLAGLVASSFCAHDCVAQAAAAALASKPIDPLTGTPYDRITLIDGLILNIDPVSPRPLLVYDAKKEAEKRAAKLQIPVGGNIGLPGEKSKIQDAAAEEAEEKRNELIIHLVEGEIRDFSMKRSSLKSIEYYEDLLLGEGERYVLSRDFGRAWECYLKVEARNPKWPGLSEHVDAALFTEGSNALLGGDSEQGLRLLRELSDRNDDYPELKDKLAVSYAGRAQRAFELGFYALGRKILHDSDSLVANHLIIRATRDRFVSRAKDLAESARSLQGFARLDALAESVRVWPGSPEVEAAYQSAFNEWPTLDVGVLDVPRGVGPWIRTPADERVTRLLYRPVLAFDDEDSIQGRTPGQLGSSLVSADLGRRVTVQLRRGLSWSDGSRGVSPIDVARSLTDMADPASPRFNARWADLLDRVETPDEDHVEIRLTRTYLKPAAWLLGPVGPAHAAGDGRVSTLDGGRRLVDDGPYLLKMPRARDTAVFLATEPSSRPDADPRAKIRRIREVRFTSSRAAIGAFTRGEIALLEHVPADRLAELSSDPEYKIGRDPRPNMHRIALDGRNPALRNRTLRRGLSYAVDRQTLLEETLLKHPADEANSVSDGPFPKGSYADASGVKPYQFDPLLARMLIVAAKRELGGQPIKLTFEYPSTPEAQAIVPKIVETFRATGLEIVAVERPESDLELELRAGRRFDLAYRSTRVDDLFSQAGDLVAPAYDAPPATDPLASFASPHILQLLLQLERAPEFTSAKTLLIQIDEESRDELPVLPLWQLEDHYAWRARLKGPGEVANRLYQGVASWEVEPWFAKDPW